MRQALTILIALAGLGLLVHAWFSPIRPFDVMLQAIRLLPRLVRQKPALVALSFTVMLILPFGGPLMGTVMPTPFFRTLGVVLWQGTLTAILALVAVKIHRGVVKRDKARWLTVGSIDRRMVATVMVVWAIVTTIGLIPVLARPVAPTIVMRLLEVAMPLVSWLVVVVLAFAGPAASLEDPAPFARSLSSVRRAPTAVAAIVILSRGLFSLAMVAISTAVALAGMTPLVVAVALPVILFGAAVAFFISEAAIAIAITRLNENLFDEDTRARDYNADWH